MKGVWESFARAMMAEAFGVRFTSPEEETKIMNITRALITAGIVAFTAAPLWAEKITLKAYTSTETALDYSQIFLQEFVEKVNEAGKGVVQIRYVGGPEITPSNKSAEAVERGIVDILYGPAGYYAGVVPESYAIMASEKNAIELRADGGYDLMDRIWRERINGHFLAWGLSDLGYSIFLTEKPNITDEKLDLAGVKVRSSPTYKPLLEVLGATPVSIPSSEFYTSLERGLVAGSGWPAVGLAGSGADKLMKFRIGPDFYRTTHFIIVNAAKWDSFSPEVKAVLDQAAVNYEVSSLERANDMLVKEKAELTAAGIETLTLTGAALSRYQEEGRAALWPLLGDSPYTADLRAIVAK